MQIRRERPVKKVRRRKQDKKFPIKKEWIEFIYHNEYGVGTRATIEAFRLGKYAIHDYFYNTWTLVIFIHNDWSGADVLAQFDTKQEAKTAMKKLYMNKKVDFNYNIISTEINPKHDIPF